VLECDLVMRGGVTSGIVYPGAVAELAKRYRFRSIGGTSAGAIAAAVTAAAEFGRRSGRNAKAFDLVAGIPDLLAKKTRNGRTFLASLFTPSEGPASTFWLVEDIGRRLAEAESKGKPGRVVPLLRALNARFAMLAVLVAAVLGVAILFAAIGAGDLLAAVCGVVLGAPLAAVVLTGAIGVWTRRQLLAIRANRFALCSGMVQSAESIEDQSGGSASVPALTDWIHRTIQSAAGLTEAESPLTFGDLWKASVCKESRAHKLRIEGFELRRSPRDVELVLMTTNLTHGMSGRIPFLESGVPLYFKESDFKEIFPKEVLQWMLAKAPLRGKADESARAAGYFRLPEPENLPLVFGARISMSFPFLLSAVPLYAIRPDKKGAPQPVWFSDGGITSNFPIHFFDAPLPTRPTFCINLVPYEQTLTAHDEKDPDTGRSQYEIASTDNDEFVGRDPDRRSFAPEDEKKKKPLVWMARGNNQAAVLTNRFDASGGLSDLGGFFFAILDTARLWGDNELMRMPGFRERIVHIAMYSAEGGLNLSMPAEVIADVAERGARAGICIGDAFDPAVERAADDAYGFANHRWVRFRAFMATQAALGQKFAYALDKWKELQPSLDDMIDGKDFPGARIGYSLADNQRQFVKEATKRFEDLMKDWINERQGDDMHSFDREEKSSSSGRSPRPKAVLSMRPPGSDDPGVDLRQPPLSS
jgi:predicted acylesterase/phospholipase RssA